jgi:acyl-coenzyme A synthetase/AMP-(fatty) acid ligase
VVAAVVLDPSTTPSEDHIIARCREFIAGYKVPKEIRFVDALPVTASGKVMKNRVRDQFRSRELPS